MTTVIVTGSRDLGKKWPNMPEHLLAKALDEVAAVGAQLHRLQPDLVIHGNARGADMIAERWCIDNKVKYKRFPAEWNIYGKSAGPIRNIAMLKSYPEAVVLGFPRGGGGTEHCLKEAKKLGMVTYEF